MHKIKNQLISKSAHWLILMLISSSLFSQSPQKMSYQAVIRDATNHLVITQVGMRISIRQGTADGTAVYTETQTPTPNANGLVTIQIGDGDPVAFAAISWAAGPYYIKTETDPDNSDGLTDYTIVGTSQILSVPYSLSAKKAEGISGTITASQVSDFQSSVTNNAEVLANTAKNSYPAADQTKLAGIVTGANVGVVPNAGITGATKTKITYDAKGLVTAGDDATTADIAASSDKNYVTNAQQIVINNTSGTNTGDQDIAAMVHTNRTALDAVSGINTGDQDLSGKVDKVTGKDLAPNGTVAGQMQYWNGTAWVTVAPGTTGQVLTFISGVPTWATTVQAFDVRNPTTGKIWMDRNLGATQVATSSTDAASYGYLYQWGRGTDGHQIRTSGTTTTLSSTDVPGHGNFICTSSSPYDWRSPQNTNLWQGVSGVNNPCPAGYRIPTETELDAERASWSSQDAAGAFVSPLKLPVAGIRAFGDGSVYSVGSEVFYWSSTIIGTNSRSLSFSSGGAGISVNCRAEGFSVRCIKD